MQPTRTQQLHPLGPGRAGALERVQLLLEEWQHARQRPADAETRMLAVL
jgi:hypothetical protein